MFGETMSATDLTAYAAIAVSVGGAVGTWIAGRRQTVRDDKKQSSEQGRLDRESTFDQMAVVNDRLNDEVMTLRAKDAEQQRQLNDLGAAKDENKARIMELAARADKCDEDRAAALVQAEKCQKENAELRNDFRGLQQTFANLRGIIEHKTGKS